MARLTTPEPDWKAMTPPERAEVYRQLEWVRYSGGANSFGVDAMPKERRVGVSKRRQFKLGWTGFAFKYLFGHWPTAWMKELTPTQPSPELMRTLRRRDREERKKRVEANNRGKIHRGAAKAARVHRSPGGNGKVEGGSVQQAVASGGGPQADRTAVVRSRRARSGGAALQLCLLETEGVEGASEGTDSPC